MADGSHFGARKEIYKTGAAVRTYGNLAQKRYLYLEQSGPKRKTKVAWLFKRV